MADHPTGEPTPGVEWGVFCTVRGWHPGFSPHFGYEHPDLGGMARPPGSQRWAVNRSLAVQTLGLEFSSRMQTCELCSLLPLVVGLAQGPRPRPGSCPSCPSLCALTGSNTERAGQSCPLCHSNLLIYSRCVVYTDTSVGPAPPGQWGRLLQRTFVDAKADALAQPVKTLLESPPSRTPHGFQSWLHRTALTATPFLRAQPPTLQTIPGHCWSYTQGHQPGTFVAKGFLCRCCLHAWPCQF